MGCYMKCLFGPIFGATCTWMMIDTTNRKLTWKPPAPIVSFNHRRIHDSPLPKFFHCLHQWSSKWGPSAESRRLEDILGWDYMRLSSVRTVLLIWQFPLSWLPLSKGCRLMKSSEKYFLNAFKKLFTERKTHNLPCNCMAFLNTLWVLKCSLICLSLGTSWPHSTWCDPQWMPKNKGSNATCCFACFAVAVL